jgi:transcriptional regulator with XRE-family HTH domain
MAKAARSFGEEVRRLIAEREMSLRAFAGGVGLDPSFLVRVLQGKQPPSRHLLEAVSAGLDLEPDYFIEARQQRLEERLSHSPALVAEIYERIEPASTAAEGIAFAGDAVMAFPGEAEPRHDLLAVLTSASTDRRVVRAAAAMLFRYRTDDDFRHKVDAALPEVERLADELKGG